MAIRLYSYWRSSAAYRVRISLNLKSLDHEVVPVSLVPGESEHRKDNYRNRNPQMLVPFLEDGDKGIAQSMAILEYLEEAYPEKPLFPSDSLARAEVRAYCNHICCDIHPLNNLRVLLYLKGELQVSEDQFNDWYSHWIHEGFRASEAQAAQHVNEGPFVFGADVTLADACLIPQVYNARRFNVSLDKFTRIVEIVEHCNSLPAFADALPEKQPDASNE